MKLFAHVIKFDRKSKILIGSGKYSVTFRSCTRHYSTSNSADLRFVLSAAVRVPAARRFPALHAVVEAGLRLLLERLRRNFGSAPRHSVHSASNSFLFSVLLRESGYFDPPFMHITARRFVQVRKRKTCKNTQPAVILR